MIKTDILKPQHKEITSFMLKNIVLWLAEEFPQTHFRRNNLFEWVAKALRLLKRAVKLYYLPYYMLPERNLLEERIPKYYQRKNLLSQIRNVIKCGPYLLKECSKIKFSMKMSPSELKDFNTKISFTEKDLIRITLIRKINYILGMTYIYDECLSDSLVSASICWPPPVREELEKCLSYQERLSFLLS